MAEAILHQPPDPAAARLRLAIDLARTHTASDLIAACRARQMRHILTGHQAAFALAAVALRASARRRH